MKSCPTCQELNEEGAPRCVGCGVLLAGPAVTRPDSVEVPLAEPEAPKVAPRAALTATKGETWEWQRQTALARPEGPRAGPPLVVGVVGLAAVSALSMAVLAAAPGAASLFFMGGWIGLVFLVMYSRDREQPWTLSNFGASFGLYLAAHAVVLGVAGVGGALWVAYRLAHGSCPHVYAHDGEGYRLDADPLSGAFLRGAEREDLVRLEHARPAGHDGGDPRSQSGRYRLEVRAELPEKDAIDSLELVFVDHDPAIDVLPTQGGAILGLARATAPTAARDGSAADRLAAVVAPDDGAFVAADTDPAAETATLDLTFARPEGAAALALALRAHATPFAEEAFARYVTAMGPGLVPLLEWADDGPTSAFRDRLQRESRQLGLPLLIEVDAGRGFEPAVELGPVGPAVQRTQAVPLPELPPGPVRVRLKWTPRFWAVDAVRLGAASTLAPTAVRAPSVALGPGGSVLEPLSAADGARVLLSQGQRIALEIEAPPGPPAGRTRTTLLRIRGYYQMDLGPGAWLDPGALLAHGLGLDTLPRFAARLARRRPDLAAAVR